MKKGIKNPLLTAAITGLVLFSGLTNAAIKVNVDKINTSNKVYTSKGYPYKNLIHRTNEVKIYYSEKTSKSNGHKHSHHSIRCRVEVELEGTIYKSVTKEVDQQSFKAEPLSSCLSRERAKQILSASFSS